MPRASRPEKARVSPVGRSVASASRCGAEVPASGQRMNAVPSAAAEGPAASTAATPPPGAPPAPPPRGERELAARGDGLQQREQPGVEAGLGVRERAAVAAGLDALDDE